MTLGVSNFPKERPQLPQVTADVAVACCCACSSGYVQAKIMATNQVMPKKIPKAVRMSTVLRFFDETFLDLAMTCGSAMRRKIPAHTTKSAISANNGCPCRIITRIVARFPRQSTACESAAGLRCCGQANAAGGLATSGQRRRPSIQWGSLQWANRMTAVRHEKGLLHETPMAFTAPVGRVC